MATKNIPAKNSFSAGAIIVSTGKTPKVLLLTQNNDYYDRPKGYGVVTDIGPKGRLEKGEDPVSAVEREIKEEINISLKIDKGFKNISEYEFEELDKDTGEVKYHVKKQVTYFLARLDEEHAKNIRLSDEHVSSRLVPISKALDDKGLKDGQKLILREVMEYLGL